MPQLELITKELADRLTSMQHIDRQARLRSAADGRIALSHNLSCLEVIMKLVKKMQAWGDERIKNTVAALSAEGMKISITADIWYSYSYT